MLCHRYFPLIITQFPVAHTVNICVNNVIDANKDQLRIQCIAVFG